jgi:hypothetical protein
MLVSHCQPCWGGPDLDAFFKPWVKAISKSVSVRRRYKSKFGESPNRHKDIRWWSKYEVLEQMMRNFAGVPDFVRELHAAGLVPKNTAKMLLVLNAPLRFLRLQLQLAATVDAGVEFVKFTYDMEGDGPLAFVVHERLARLSAFVSAPKFPNLEALTRHLTAAAVPPPETAQQLFDLGVRSVAPGLIYWNKKLAELDKQFKAFKGASIFDPNKARDMSAMSLTQHIRDNLPSFDFVSPDDVTALLQEVPAYLAATQHLPTAAERAEEGLEGKDLRSFWREKKEQLPAMFTLVRKILLVQPSSAACERVFSILTNNFNPQQDHALADFIETSMMLRYNHKPAK